MTYTIAQGPRLKFDEVWLWTGSRADSVDPRPRMRGDNQMPQTIGLFVDQIDDTAKVRIVHRRQYVVQDDNSILFACLLGQGQIDAEPKVSRCASL